MGAYFSFIQLFDCKIALTDGNVALRQFTVESYTVSHIAIDRSSIPREIIDYLRTLVSTGENHSYIS